MRCDRQTGRQTKIYTCCSNLLVFPCHFSALWSTDWKTGKDLHRLLWLTGLSLAPQCAVIHWMTDKRSMYVALNYWSFSATLVWGDRQTGRQRSRYVAPMYWSFSAASVHFDRLEDRQRSTHVALTSWSFSATPVHCSRTTDGTDWKTVEEKDLCMLLWLPGPSLRPQCAVVEQQMGQTGRQWKKKIYACCSDLLVFLCDLSAL